MQPGNKYRVSVKDDRLERASPDHLDVDLQSNDVTELMFVSFRSSTKSDVCGVVIGDTQSVALKMKEEIVGLHNGSGYFEFREVVPGNYVLVATRSDGRKGYVELSFTLDPQNRNVPEGMKWTGVRRLFAVLDARISEKDIEQTHQSSPIFALLVILGIAAAYAWRTGMIPIPGKRQTKPQDLSDNVDKKGSFLKGTVFKSKK